MAAVNGTVEWVPRTPKSARPAYLIQAKPHVMIRLKRAMVRINKGQVGTCLLDDTPENARELLWFCDRFPLAITTQARLHLEAGDAAHRRREEQIQTILEGRAVSSTSLEMAIPARPYQQLAADLVCSTGRLLLADDLGLGKTCAALAAIATSGKLPALVVTLTHLPRQWAAECARFLPGLRVAILKTGKPHPIDADIIISNYHKLGGWAEEFAGRVRTIIFDECQELRSGSGTVKYSSAVAIASQAEIRMGLSATPIYNYGGEMYNVLTALDPDCLGESDEFFREWCKDEAGFADRKVHLKDPGAFGAYLRDSGIMLRRTRADVGRELPALSTIPYEIDSDRYQMDKFAHHAQALAEVILAQTENQKGDRMRASAELDWQLRRATGVAKASFVAEFVKMLVDGGERVVLYGWHHDVYDIWRAHLKDHRPAFYTGSETPAAKEREINRFRNGDTPIAILSLRSGAGLDGLQATCRTVVFGELDWSPGVHEQAIGRVHRDGQTQPVCAYFLLSESGSDPVIADTLGVKRGQITGLRDPDAPLTEAGVDPHHIRRLAEHILGRPKTDIPLPPVQPRLATPKPNFSQLSLFEESHAVHKG